MSKRTNYPRPPTPNLPYSSNKQEFPTLSNSSLVKKNKSPSPSQTPSPTKQNGVNSCKTSPSYEIPPRYKNFNYGGEKNRQQNEIPNSSSFKSCNGQSRRLRTRSGSKSPPPLEPKLETIKETQLLKPKAEKGIQIKPRPEPVLSKEKLEAKTPTEPSTPSVQKNTFVFTPKDAVGTEPTSTTTTKSKSRPSPLPSPTQSMNEYCEHFSIKTKVPSTTTPLLCSFCDSYIFRPYFETNCCGKIYHSECLSMLYTDKISFDLKNGNTMPYIYFRCECGFSNLDKEGRNYNNLSKIHKSFEVGIKEYIKV